MGTIARYCLGGAVGTVMALTAGAAYAACDDKDYSGCEGKPWVVGKAETPIGEKWWPNKLWGEGDEAGSTNWYTKPEVVARAVKEADKGRVYALGRPYTEFDTVNPRSMYGRSKEAGEQLVRRTLDRHYIVRTSWVHGADGGNFAKTMLRLGRERGAVSVVDDQTGSPTFTFDLAPQIRRLAATGRPGTYNLTNRGHCTWFEFAAAIFDGAGLDVDLTPTDTASFGAPAHRPAYSVLDNLMARQVGLPDMPHWQDSLKVLLQEIA